jgi:hypothetical protein
MKSAILSNQRLINEIDSIRDNFIQSRPHMAMSVFKSTRKHGDRRTNKYDNIVDRPIFKDDRGAGSPAFQSHPLSYQPPGGNTLRPDPLFSGVVDRPTPRGGAMLKRPMPLTGEDSSDDEGAGYLNGYSSSDDEDDYDDGAGLVDDVKEKYHKVKEYVKSKMPSKAELKKVSNDVLKMITSKEAANLGVNALKVAIAAYVVSKLGGYGAPVVAAANKAIDEIVVHAKGEYVHTPTEEQMRSAIRGVPVKAGALKKKRPAPIVGHKRGERVRGDVVAEIMRKKGLSLGAASKYVKEHNLY